MNLYNKLSIIEFCKEEEVNIYEFTFGQVLSSGHVNFGMVAISKENNALDAISCLYTLNFQIATVLVTRRKKKRFAGINMGTSRRSWHEPKRAFVNFCRYKAITYKYCVFSCRCFECVKLYRIIVVCGQNIHKEERHFG